MDLATVAAGAEWMDDGERKLTCDITLAMAQDFARRGVPDSPLLAMRLEDVIVSYLHVRRAELAIGKPSEAKDANEDAKDKVKGSVKGNVRENAALIEAAGKARERLRKAMKELEETYAKTAPSIHGGIAVQMKPLLKKAEGVLEDALRYEAEKKEKEPGEMG
jgi:hypothetical protein